MQNSKKPSQSSAIIILRQMEKHEWLFDIPRITPEVHERLGEGIDWMEQNLKRSEAVFRDLVRQYPEHIDAHHHLALTLDRMGKYDEAFELWERVVKTSLQFFPPHFSIKRDRLQWGFLENRPFLRLYHSYGLGLRDRGRSEEALEVFENILSINPRDNQGVRALVVDCYLALKKPEGVLSLCRRYSRDGLEQVMFGRALALFQLGKLKEAGKALDRAILYYPLVAAEIAKAKHKRIDKNKERYVVVASQQQALLYWADQGKYWKETPGAIDFVRVRLAGKAG